MGIVILNSDKTYLMNCVAVKTYLGSFEIALDLEILVGA